MKLTLPCLVAATALLSACNIGSDSNAGSGLTTQPTPQRGQLVMTPPTSTGTYGPADLVTLLTGNSIAAQFLQLSFTPICTVTVYHIEYYTVGAKSESTQASGALMIPSGSASGCSGPRPIVEYAHATTPDKTFNIADLSRADNDEGLLLAAAFASQGYIVVAPNYAGYDTSTLGYHPYLVADQQSKDMIDALAASRAALTGTLSPPSTDNGKLFITGYSQGGFVAMATARAMQGAGTVVTAAAPMSGPYALAAFGDAVFDGEVDLSATLNTTLLLGALPADLRQHLQPAHRRLHRPIRHRHRDAAAEHHADHDPLRPGTAAAIPPVQRYAPRLRVRNHYATDHSGEPGAGFRARIRGSAAGAEFLPRLLSRGRRRRARRRFPDRHHESACGRAHQHAARGAQGQ